MLGTHACTRTKREGKEVHGDLLLEKKINRAPLLDIAALRQFTVLKYTFCCVKLWKKRGISDCVGIWCQHFDVPSSRYPVPK